MTKQAIEARRAYKRKWAQDHPEKVREYQERYWTKQAERAEIEQEAQRAEDQKE